MYRIIFLFRRLQSHKLLYVVSGRDGSMLPQGNADIKPGDLNKKCLSQNVWRQGIIMW